MGENLVLFLCLLLPCLSAGLLGWIYRKRHASPETKSPLPVILFANGLMLVFLLSLLVLAGEVYFRFVYDSTDSLMFTKVSRRWMERYYHYNTAGMRDDIQYRQFVAPGKRRVTFLGDSFTAGHGIKDVANRFPNILRRDHPDWEVHVLAQPGFDTGDELHFLDTLLYTGYQADQFVLVYCLNDISDMIAERRDAIDRVNASVQQSGWLRQNSYLVNIAYHRVQVLRDPFMRGYFDLVEGAYRGPLWVEQQKRLTLLANKIRAHGGQVAVVTFPFLHALGPDYRYAFVHQELGEFWAQMQVPHLDLLPAFEGLKPSQITVNRFDAHPNEAAHRLVAPQIGDFIARQLSSKSVPTNSTAARF
jgi:lysophospholipase L1-like esterase